MSCGLGKIGFELLIVHETREYQLLKAFLQNYWQF